MAGLTASAGVAGWVEFALLRSALNRRIGVTGLPAAGDGEALGLGGDRGRGGLGGAFPAGTC